MARLIDVDKAIINFGFEWDDISPTREEFVEFLKRQPDATVHCKDCRYSHASRVARYCHMMQVFGYLADSRMVDDDGFCDMGCREGNE